MTLIGRKKYLNNYHQAWTQLVEGELTLVEEPYALCHTDFIKQETHSVWPGVVRNALAKMTFAIPGEHNPTK